MSTNATIFYQKDDGEDEVTSARRVLNPLLQPVSDSPKQYFLKKS